MNIIENEGNIYTIKGDFQKYGQYAKLLKYAKIGISRGKNLRIHILTGTIDDFYKGLGQVVAEKFQKLEEFDNNTNGLIFLGQIILGDISPKPYQIVVESEQKIYTIEKEKDYEDKIN